MNQIHKWWGTYFSLQLGWFTGGITNRRTEKCKIIPFCWSLGVALANRDGGKHLWKIEWGIRKIEWEWRGEDQSTKKRQECGDEMLEQEKWLQHTRKSGEAAVHKERHFTSHKGREMMKEGLAEFFTVCLCSLHCCAACMLDITIASGAFLSLFLPVPSRELYGHVNPSFHFKESGWHNPVGNLRRGL